jgi:hypothetical protein
MFIPTAYRYLPFIGIVGAAGVLTRKKKLYDGKELAQTAAATRFTTPINPYIDTGSGRLTQLLRMLRGF